MDALIVYPKNEEQLTALKAVMIAMKVAFEQKKSEAYPDHVISGVKKSVQQAEQDKFIPYKGIKEMLELPN